MQEKYLKEKEVSEMTGIALSTLRNDRAGKRLIPYIKVSRSIRYSYRDIVEFMESRKIKAEAA
jgi:hypothetical protein